MSQIRPRSMPTKLKKQPPKLRKRLSPVSAKRQEEKRLYRIASKEYLAEHPICEWEDTGCSPLAGFVAFPVPCVRPSRQIHHKAGKEGRLLYDKRYFMAVCNEHGGIYPHIHSGESYEKGFMVLRHNISSK